MPDDIIPTPPPSDADTVLEEILNPEEGDDSRRDDYFVRIKELEAALARSQADYQNLVMRSERDKLELATYLASRMFWPLLMHVDNLERAVQLKEWVQWDTFIDGVRSVLSGMIKYLESQKIYVFTSIWETVDPAKHEVMTQMVGPEGKIIQEFEKGYMIADKVLRHAKVVVGSGE
jgi:molecular chaperone GrpE